MLERTIAERTLFIGGHEGLASTQIRCRQIAEAIGAAWTAPGRPGHSWQNQLDESVLASRDIFVLVKSRIDRRSLQSRGHVIWDVIDGGPRRAWIDAFFTSTTAAAKLLGPYVQVYVVPHHHCNFANAFVKCSRTRGRMVWIGALTGPPKDIERREVEIYTIRPFLQNSFHGSIVEPTF